MRISRLSLLLALLLLPVSIQAQQKRKKVIKKPVVVVAPEPEEDPRITEMRELTQQIVFIDSIVTDKADVLSQIRLNDESGQLMDFDKFFRTQGHDDAYVFLNEMGNKCYFSEPDGKGNMKLFTSDKLGNEWSDPVTLRGLSSGLTGTNYPFMMTDGTTFYFAAKGEESIGGYDIFFTRYDAEDGKFLKPENIGMPFNSEANDYLYVIDEFSNIGYFVTDRRQPEGKVCVYLFIPPTSRKTYNIDNYSEEQIRAFADIASIANTWGNDQARKAALERLKTTANNQADSPVQDEIAFIVNDQLTYTSPRQFRCHESLPLYRKLTEMKKQLSDTEAQLEKSRNFYARVKADDRLTLRKEILEAEQLQENLTAEVKALEKRIRNEENRLINP